MYAPDLPSFTVLAQISRSNSKAQNRHGEVTYYIVLFFHTA